MSTLGKVGDIVPDQFSSWQKKLFLTFDLDWAIDPVIHFVLDILEKHEIGATFFVTHQSEAVERIRSNSLHEVGIHPNFNGLIDSTNSSSYTKVIDELLERVGPVKIVRSHSLFQSSHILDYFFINGKQILRKTLSKYLDATVTDNKKQEFSSPDVPWFRGGSIEYLQKKLLNVPPIFNADIVQEILKEHVSGTKNNRLAVWSLLYIKK